MGIVSIIWVTVGLILWVSYKLTNHEAHDVLTGPCQCTLLGAMTWPFFLLEFLLSVIRGQRVEISDK
jgi:hypothetical protein